MERNTKVAWRKLFLFLIKITVNIYIKNIDIFKLDLFFSNVNVAYYTPIYVHDIVFSNEIYLHNLNKIIRNL